MNTTPDSLRRFGIEHPAASGLVVQQGHADYCAAYGHATWTENGVVQPRCSRCGELRPVEAVEADQAIQDARGLTASVPTDAERQAALLRAQAENDAYKAGRARAQAITVYAQAQLTAEAANARLADVELRHETDLAPNATLPEGWWFWQVEATPSLNVFAALYTGHEDGHYYLALDVRTSQDDEPITQLGELTLTDPSAELVAFALMGAVALTATGQPLA